MLCIASISKLVNLITLNMSKTTWYILYFDIIAAFILLTIRLRSLYNSTTHQIHYIM